MTKTSTTYAKVDKILANIEQGDFDLQQKAFIFGFNPTHRITVSEDVETTEALGFVDEEVAGLVVLTQTCDIVRQAELRPFIEVAALVRLENGSFTEAKHARTPRYAFLPATENLGLVADLDRTMTLEKGALLLWQPQKGLRNDHERREFATALARKRQRFAFPDEFNAMIKDFQKRCKDKHSKNSDEGRSLRLIREIRIQAQPDWGHARPTLRFFFLIEDSSSTEDKTKVETHTDDLLGRINPAETKYKKVDGKVLRYCELSASDYVGSDRLDLDHISRDS